MNLVRWNDDRLDGFAADFQVTDTKVDHIVVDMATMKHEISDLQKSQDTNRNNRWNLWMILATWASPVATVIVLIWKK